MKKNIYLVCWGPADQWVADVDWLGLESEVEPIELWQQVCVQYKTEAEGTHDFIFQDLATAWE